MRQNRDILWKGVLQWVFEDLLRFVFADADQVFDFDKQFEILDKELGALDWEPGKKNDVVFADNLFKVFRKDGEEDWVLLHVEIQDNTKASDRPQFPERMFKYFYRCYDFHNKPIAAIAIFCGPDGKLLGDTFRYSFMRTRLEYVYDVVRILDYSDEELGNSTNPFAWVALIAKYALLAGKDLDEQLLKGKLFVFRKLHENGLFEKKNLQAILEFMDIYLRFEKPETNRIFRKEIDEITHKKNTMDIFEVVTEIKIEEKVNERNYRFVKNLLTTQTAMPMEEIAAVAEVAIDFVKEVKQDLTK